MNPVKLMQMKGLLKQFQTNHPKILPFFEAAGDAIDENTIISVEIQTAQGKRLRTNIRVNAADMELLQKWKES